VSTRFDNEHPEYYLERGSQTTGSSRVPMLVPACLSSATSSVTAVNQEETALFLKKGTYSIYQDTLSFLHKINELRIEIVNPLELVDYLNSNKELQSVAEEFIERICEVFTISEVAVEGEPDDKYILIKVDETEAVEDFDDFVLDLYGQFEGALSSTSGWIHVRSSLER